MSVWAQVRVTSLLAAFPRVFLAWILTACGADAVAAELPPITAQTSLLVISPHPDDETLCCAGFIQRVLRAGGLASIVWLTSGDASKLDLLIVEKSVVINPGKLRDLGRQRMQEARDAAAILGVSPDHEYFLGYPDRGLWTVLTAPGAGAYHSKYTDTSAVPYTAALSPGHPYTNESLEHDFAAVLDRVRPNFILAPSLQDTHPDHRAAGLLTLRALERRRESPTTLYWIVHGGAGWPEPRGLEPELTLTPAPRAAGLSPVPFQLTPAEERTKLAALRAYETQMATMSSVLLSYVRTNELYSTRATPGSP